MDLGASRRSQHYGCHADSTQYLDLGDARDHRPGFRARSLPAHFTGSTVLGWDGFTTALSLAAIYGQTKEYVESWWIWIAADVIYMPLYLVFFCYA